MSQIGFHQNPMQDTSDILSQTREMLNDEAVYSHGEGSTTTHNLIQHQQTGLQNTLTPPPTIMNTDMNTHRPITHSNQGVHASGTDFTDQSKTQSWIANMFNGLDKRWKTIESHLETQDKRWEHVQNQMEHQNKRMGNIEEQLTQIHEIKQTLSTTQAHVHKLDQTVSKISSKIEQYDTSILHYSDICDSIVRSSAESNSRLDDVVKRLTHIEFKQSQIHSNQTKNDERLIDLQCRSMRQNLIFTGICEPELTRGQYENVENTLKRFLITEMQIDIDIKFDRVHRLGRSSYHQPYPRPIIARFESFKDREYVRAAAPKSLVGKRYGVREQFPPEIEQKRKLLYPIAKRARQNRMNTVRLVRDKLYVNGREINPDDNTENVPESYNRQGQEPNYKPRSYNYANAARQVPSSKQNDYPNEHSYRTPRTAPYKPRGTNWGYLQNQTIQDVQTQNRFQILEDMDNELSNDRFYQTREGNYKKKATSPLDYDLSFKKRKDQTAQKPNNEIRETRTPNMQDCGDFTKLDSCKSNEITRQGTCKVANESISASRVTENSDSSCTDGICIASTSKSDEDFGVPWAEEGADRGSRMDTSEIPSASGVAENSDASCRGVLFLASTSNSDSSAQSERDTLVRSEDSVIVINEHESTSSCSQYIPPNAGAATKQSPPSEGNSISSQIPKCADSSPYYGPKVVRPDGATGKNPDTSHTNIQVLKTGSSSCSETHK